MKSKKVESMSDADFKDSLERMFKKGGNVHFSLTEGSRINIKREPSRIIMPPVEGAKGYFESKKKQKVFYL